MRFNAVLMRAICTGMSCQRRLTRGLLSEGLFYTILQRSERRCVTHSAKTGDVGLRVVLVAVLQVAGKGNVLDLARPMHLHQSFGDGLEGARLSGACVDHGVDRFFGAIRQ